MASAVGKTSMPIVPFFDGAGALITLLQFPFVLRESGGRFILTDG